MAQCPRGPNRAAIASCNLVRVSSLSSLFPRYEEFATLNAAISMMNWDQQVLMPDGGATARASHVGLLRKRAHQLLTSDEMRRDLERVESEAEEGSREAAAAAALRREIEVQTKLPISLVERKAALTSEAYEVWRRARPANDYAAMEPYYREVFAIARETADAIGWTEHPYDPLISLYEFGATYAEARGMFDQVLPATRELLKDRGEPTDDAVLAQTFEPETLRALAEAMARKIGFNFGQGRLDVCRNAFCTHFANTDVRMTTRPSDHFKGIISSSLHEMGHALYEQNIDPTFELSPLMGGTSLAVHESQSRLWENVIGRSLGFWTHFLPLAQSHLPQLAGVTPQVMFGMMNKVLAEPNRVGADELTYNMHILVRFELEVELVTGRLSTKDLPEAWNAKYADYLGLKIESNTLGCLQDVHWSKASVGYFPTYSFGNMIGLQIWDVLVSELGDQEANFAAGNFEPVLSWLTDRVYRHGKRYEPKTLVQNITGTTMRPDAWTRYARSKYGSI